MKNMEDVWKDIRLNNLKERPNRSYDEMEPTESCRRMMLQEFLARPFAEHQQRLSEVSGQHTKMDMGGAFSGASHRRPATALSLNSSSGQFNYLASIGLVPNIPPRSQPLNCCSGGVSTLEPSMVPSPPTSTFEAVGSSFCKKRVPENLDTSGDRRHQRMIRNRESAARSRARKQAYTNELEQEVAHLVEENARLKEHHQKSSISSNLVAVAVAFGSLCSCSHKEQAPKKFHCPILKAPFRSVSTNRRRGLQGGRNQSLEHMILLR